MIYKIMPINTCCLKFFSTQQIFNVNNYIKNKIANSEEKRAELKHLLYHLIENKINKLDTYYIYR